LEDFFVSLFSLICPASILQSLSTFNIELQIKTNGQVKLFIFEKKLSASISFSLPSLQIVIFLVSLSSLQAEVGSISITEQYFILFIGFVAEVHIKCIGILQPATNNIVDKSIITANKNQLAFTKTDAITIFPSI
jgi:hypothetical protein